MKDEKGYDDKYMRKEIYYLIALYRIEKHKNRKKENHHFRFLFYLLNEKNYYV